MHMNDYQMLAQRTSPPGHDRVLNGVMGLAGESGECVDVVKKAVFQGHSCDYEKLREELGDVLWYCAELATGLGTTLDDVAEMNIKKLMRRYPDGFTPEDSIRRVDVNEDEKASAGM